MNEIVKALIEFVLLFLLVFCTYKLIYRKKKDFSKLKDNNSIKTFVLKYDLDVRKIDYRKLVNVILLINSFIISFTAIIIIQIDSLMWSILTSVFIILVLMITLFEIAGRYFKKEEKKYKEPVVEKEIDKVVKDIKKKKTKRKKEK